MIIVVKDVGQIMIPNKEPKFLPEGVLEDKMAEKLTGLLEIGRDRWLFVRVKKITKKHVFVCIGVGFKNALDFSDALMNVTQNDGGKTHPRSLLCLTGAVKINQPLVFHPYIKLNQLNSDSA